MSFEKGRWVLRGKFLGGRILPLAANVYREGGAVRGPRRGPLLEFPSARRAASHGKEHSHETDSHKLQNQAGDDRGKSKTDRERVSRTADKIGGWFSLCGLETRRRKLSALLRGRGRRQPHGGDRSFPVVPSRS